MAEKQAQFGLVVGASRPWPELVERARQAEQLGWDSIWVADHFFGGQDERADYHEAYTVLAGLAMATERVRLGVMVAGNTYRNPIVLLKQAVTVDHISNGRTDFGIGAGWWEREHEAYSYRFPPPGERVDMLAEALEAIDSLQRNERTTLNGKHYHFENAPLEPKPVQEPRLPVVIGASGPRMLGITAKHADIWNTRSEIDEARRKSQLLDEYCHGLGRDPDEVTRSVWPAANQLDSSEQFKGYVNEFSAAGFSHFLFGWPRDDQQEAVLKDVSSNLLPELRGNG